jgi:ERCC4-related helicase
VGLDIDAAVVLPFLLAGRAQALFATSIQGRALFAEGLASSFEAYLETQSEVAPAVDEDGDLGSVKATPELDWYLRHLDRALPRRGRRVQAAHPKVQATAERAVALWSVGEKVLIFCHYRATGRALRQHISSLLHEKIIRLGQMRLPGSSPDAVQKRLDVIGDRFFDEEDAVKGVVTKWLRKIVRKWPNLSEQQRDKVVEVVRRFIRTPSFLVRYLPIESTNLASAFLAAVEHPVDGRASLRGSIEHFCEFLAERCIDSERDSYLFALDKVQTGTHVGRELRGRIDPAEGPRERHGAILLPNVRLANGEVRSDTRQRLMLTFNTPLFPEILIASSVMAEGVDLHLNCRYVIHHDLSWNPSTLEQRSGRVDRIGCKAERVGESINIYMPYVAATQDEKMFRVVRDRERWFQIVMGEKYHVDEAATDRASQRLPLPESVRAELAMRLHPAEPPTAILTVTANRDKSEGWREGRSQTDAAARTVAGVTKALPMGFAEDAASPLR